MKRVWIFLVTFVNVGLLNAQHTADSLLLNYVVPDIPAFNALGISPSDVLRPSDVKKFAVSMAPYARFNNPYIPKNFALEFAPFKALSKNLTMYDYHTKAFERLKYNSAFSMASMYDTGSYRNKLSLGYRFSLASKKADILRAFYVDSSLLRYKIDSATQIQDRLRTVWLSTVVVRPPSFYLDHRDSFDFFLKNIEQYLADSFNTNPSRFTPEVKAAIRADLAQLRRIMGEKFHLRNSRMLGDSLSSLLARTKQRFEDSLWNGSRFDFATALIWQSSDSLVKNSQFASFHLWTTYALRCGSRGQFLFGFKGMLPRTIEKALHISASAIVRGYYGNKDFRGYLETQGVYRNYGTYNKTLSLSLGAELRIGQSFWLGASGGLANYFDDNSANAAFNRLIASFDIRYSINKP